MSATALLGGAVAGCGDARHSLDSQPSVSTDVEEPAAKLEPVQWNADTKYTYALSLSSQADVENQGAMFDFDLAATLVVVPVVPTLKKTQLHFHLENPVFRSRDKEEAKAKQFEQLTGEVTSPFFASYARGRMDDIYLKQEISAFTAGIQRTLASGLQNVPSDSPNKPWQVTEYDATGAYSAEYGFDTKTGVIKKRKLKYTETLQDKRSTQKLAQNVGLPQMTSSSGEIRVEKGAIQKIVLADSFSMPVTTGSALSSQTRMVLELKEQKPGAAPPDWQRLRRSYQRYAKDEAILRPVSQEVLDAARMRGMKFKQVVVQLEAMSKDSKRVGELQKAVNAGLDEQKAMAQGKKWMGNWMTLFNALPAFFRQQPQTVARAVARIEQGSPARESLLGGLSAAGTEASQQALLKIAKGKQTPEEVKESAMVSLIRCKDPQPSTTKAISDMLEGDHELRTYALYGLGTMSRNLRDGGKTEESNTLAVRLTKSLEQAKDRSEQTNILYGIANSGYAGALGAVRPYLSHRHPSLRSAALAAIRLMDHPEVDGLIAAAMDPEQEKERTVREAAILAAKPRKPSATLSAGLAKAALQDEKKSARFKAVQLLSRWLPTYPAARETLQKVAQNEQELIIRNTADAALKKAEVAAK